MTLLLNQSIVNSKAEIYPCGEFQEPPLVSVIMPTYRLRPNQLTQKAIESVLSQSFTDFEFIIVDDGSVDGLFEELQGYLQRDTRITLVRNLVNSGLPAARVNQGARLARGQYLAYMFEDDEWYPDALKIMLETIQASDEPCAVYGIVDVEMETPNGVENSRLGDWEFNYALLKNSNKIANCAVMHPRWFFDTCGMYDPHILVRRLSDYDLWLRMGRFFAFKPCRKLIGKTSKIMNLLDESNEQRGFELRYIETERIETLKSSRLQHYQINQINFTADPAEINLLQERYLIPFLAKHPLIIPEKEKMPYLASSEVGHRLLVTKSDYSTSVDQHIRNFEEVLDKSLISSFYLEERKLQHGFLDNFDILVLYRTITGQSFTKLQDVRQNQKAVIYLMDDNMLQFGKGYLAEEYSFLKPDTPGFRTLAKEISLSDIVISYSTKISEDCAVYNPKIFQFRENIREYLISPATALNGGRQTGRKLKFALITGMARRKELQELWPDLEEFSRRHAEEVEFYLWGFDPSEFGQLHCTTFSRPFDYSYERYLSAIRSEQFDYVVCPLFPDHEVKISKSPIKYLEAIVAGAVGIFSDSPVYRRVIEDGLNGFLTADDRWLDALERAYATPDAERQAMFTAAKAHALARYTTESQVLEYLSAFEAARLHAGLRSYSAPGGRARVAYFIHESALGGATLHAMRHAAIARQYGFDPLLVFPSGPVAEEAQRFARQRGLAFTSLPFRVTTHRRDPDLGDRQRADQLAAWMKAQGIRLVHGVTYLADVALAAYQLRIPYVNTLHQHYANPSGTQARGERLVTVVHSSSLRYARAWQEELGAPAYTLRAPVEASYFDQYLERQDREMHSPPTFLLSGTLQPRKGQLAAIQAIAELRKQGIPARLALVGYDVFAPQYVAECRQALRSLKLEDLVTITGFSERPGQYFAEADFMLCASDDESMPQTILQAMAAGMPVVSTHVGGVTEVILDGFSGVLAGGNQPEQLVEAMRRAIEMRADQRRKLVETAHLTAQMVCSEEVVSYQLLKLYNTAVRENQRVHGIHHPPYDQG